MNKVLSVTIGGSVDLGTTPADTFTLFRNKIDAAGWQILFEQNTEAGRFLDCVPPASSPVGNAAGREVVRVEVKTQPDQIVFTAGITSDTGRAGTYQVAGAATGSFSPKWNANFNFGSYLFSVQLPNNSTSAQTAQTIYNALTADQNASVKAYAFTLNGDKIMLQAKSAAAPAVTAASGSGIPVSIISDNYTAGTTQLQPTTVKTLAIDLANGFYYHLVITNRSLVLATKTLTGTFGPMYATYGDHAAAVAQTPPSCFPVELFVVNLHDKTAGSKWQDSTSYAHVWGIGKGSRNASLLTAFDSVDRSTVPATRLEDMVFVNRSYNTASLPQTEFRPMNVNNSIDPALWQSLYGTTGIVTYMAASFGMSTNDNSYGNFPSYTAMPILALPDLATFIGTAADESLQYTSDTSKGANLSADLGAADATLTLTTTADFPAAGYAFTSAGEVLTYTGKTATTLTGLTRAKGGTTAKAVSAGGVVYPSLWFLKFRAGAILCGNTRPNVG